jgi:hypothetical protein
MKNRFTIGIFERIHVKMHEIIKIKKLRLGIEIAALQIDEFNPNTSFAIIFIR